MMNDNNKAEKKSDLRKEESVEERPSFLQKLTHQNEHFFASTWGQRLLLVLAPFILLPNEKGHQNDQLRALFERLHTGLWSPLLGSFFFISSLVVTLKAYQNYGLHLEWLVNFGSGKFLIYCTALLSIFAYNAALARWIAPYSVRLIARDKDVPGYSLHFWTIRYGGLLVFCGLVGWFFTGITWLNLPFWAFLIALFLLVALVYFARKEIGYQNQKLSAATPTRHVALLHMLEIILFFIILAGEAIIYFYFFFKEQPAPNL